jgi:iron complex outermembrane receptor protein
LALSLFAAAAPGAALSQEEAHIEDVRVGASVDGLTRQEEKVLVKTPRAGEIVTGAKAVEEHLERLSDMSQLVPNYRPNIQNPQTSTPAIRGVGVGAGTGAGAESETGFVIDNVFYKYVGFQWADFVELESFELGLGPQGTAGGKNTTVGNVFVRTQLPSFERKATLETSFGNYTHFIEKLNVTGPIIDDKLAYRVALYLDKSDGWINDQVSGAGYLNNDRWGARGQLLYVGDDVTDRLIFNYGISHEYIGANHHTMPFGDSVSLYANGTLGDSFSQTLWKRLRWPLLTLDPYKPIYTHSAAFHQRTITASNELNWQVGGYTLTSISAWGIFIDHPNYTYGNENQGLELVSGFSDPYASQFSQEFRLTSPRDQQVEWQAGLYAFYEKIWSFSRSDYGSNAAQWFGGYATDPQLLNRVEQHTDGWSRTFQIAGYGQATVHVDEKLDLTFGLRDSYEIKEGSVVGFERFWNTDYTLAQIDAAVRGAGGGGFYDTGGLTKSRNMLTGIFNPSYKVSDNLTVFALIGRGEKAPQVNVSARPIRSGGAIKGFQPLFAEAESNWDYEFGAKTIWLDGKLIANANLYWTDIYNFQSNIVDTSFTDATGQSLRLTYLGNVPHVRLRGFEFAGRWSPVDRLWFSFNGAYTEARYIDFADAPPPADWVWPTPTGASADFIKAPLSLSRTNSRWELLPKWTFNVGANYQHPLGPLFRDLGVENNISGFGYVNVAWQDKMQMTNPWSVIQYWQSAYSIVNAGVGLRTEDEKYSFWLWVKNIADTRWIKTWSPGSPTNAATVQLLDFPRSFGGTLRVSLY